MTKSSPSGACRRRRWPWWWSANSPSAASCRKTTSKCVATFRPTGDPKARRVPGHLVSRTRCAPERGRRQGIAAAGDAAARRWRRGRSASWRAPAPARPPSNRSNPKRSAWRRPLLYDLTELQRHANRLFGFSAQKTLDIAQALYERHKLISYPRTDSRHLSQDVAHTLPRVVEAIAEPYREHLAPGTGERPLGRRFVDDSKVTDHHAIIPTTTSAGKALAHSRRAQDLRSDLPPPAQRLARRPHLVGHHRDHRDSQ